MNTKKPKPIPEQDAQTYPYMLVKKYADTRFYRSWQAAREAIVNELLGLRDGFEMMGWQDSIAAVDAVLDKARKLWPEKGAVVEGLVDPDTGQRYRVELVKRDRLG